MNQTFRSTRPRSRYGWIWITALLLLVIVGCFWGAAQIGQHRDASAFREKVEALQKRSLPTTPEDLTDAGIRDSQNKVLAWEAAANLLPQDSTSQKAWDLRWSVGLPLTDDEVKWARQIQADAKPAEPLLLDASSRPRIHWPIDWKAIIPDYRLNFPRSLSNQAKTEALLEHHNGNEKEAIRQLERMVELAKAMESHPMLVGFLVSSGLWASAADLVQMISLDLKVGNDDQQVSAETARKLIAVFLQDDSSVAAFKGSLRGERVFVINTMLRLQSEDVNLSPDSPLGGSKGVDWLTTFRAKRSLWASGSFLLQNMDHVERVVELKDEQSAVVAATLTPAQNEALNGLPLAKIAWPSYQRSIAQVFRVQNARRLAAATLAIRLYSLEHQGQLPKSLEALVPDYLPAVPWDAQAANKPIQYLPDLNRPILYVVGENYMNDGGRERTDEMSGSAARSTTDEVVHLKRQPRKPEPEPDNNSDEP